MRYRDITWLNLTNLIWNNLKTVEIPQTGPIPNAALWLRKQPEENNQAADEAVDCFVAEWKWPPNLPDDVRYQLYFRSLYAMEVCRALDMNGVPQPGANCNTELKKLLVDMWRKNGFDWADDRFLKKSWKEDPGKFPPMR